MGVNEKPIVMQTNEGTTTHSRIFCNLKTASFVLRIFEKPPRKGRLSLFSDQYGSKEKLDVRVISVLIVPPNGSVTVTSYFPGSVSSPN